MGLREGGGCSCHENENDKSSCHKVGNGEVGSVWTPRNGQTKQFESQAKLTCTSKTSEFDKDVDI